MRGHPPRAAEDRYSRDVRRYELAVRFIHHGARTDTVRCWSGLSESSVRRIRQACGQAVRKATLAGKRGRVPHRVTRDLVSRRNRVESAAFIGLCRLTGLIPAQPLSRAKRTFPSIARGEALCEAFERFRALVPDGTVTLDQLARVLLSVVEGAELSLTRCAGCGSIWLFDLSGEISHRCLLCTELSRLARAPAPQPLNGSASTWLADPESAQGRLFP